MKGKATLYTTTSLTSHGKHALLLEQNVKTHSDQLFTKSAIFTFAFSEDNQLTQQTHHLPTNQNDLS